MFFHAMILGDRLPRGTVCVTYDDGPGRTESPSGPGPRTPELSAYLHHQGVPAAFFVAGKFAEVFADILSNLQSLGHLVANHTYDHPSLPAFVARGGDVVDQLKRTAAILGSRAGGARTLFRPPYGDWWLQGHACSNVASALNHSELAATHVGPIGWDIDAGDIGFWRDGRPPGECAHAYVDAVEDKGRGIILMHDSTADIAELRPKNRGYELTRVLIPELRARGFRFVRLDRVPQVASAALVSSAVVLTACDGRRLSNPSPGGDVVLISRPDRDPAEIWGVVKLDGDRWALRSPTGLFLSARRDGQVVADADALGDRETFLAEPPSGSTITLRSADGAYLMPDSGQSDRLITSRAPRNERMVFAVDQLC